MTKSYYKNQDYLPKEIRLVPPPILKYCCYNLYALVNHVRLFQINQGCKIIPVHTYEGEDCGFYEADEKLGLEQWEYCPYCGKHVFKNEEYKKWEKEEDEKYLKISRFRCKQEFIKIHRGHDDHVLSGIITEPMYFSSIGQPVLPIYRSKCKYCYEIVEIDLNKYNVSYNNDLST